MNRNRSRHSEQEESLFGGSSVDDSRKLGVVRATFVGHEQSSFEDLISGYSSMRVLTYSNSLSMISKAASLVEDLEIVFGREDLVGEAERLYWHQDELVRAVRDEIGTVDPLRQRVQEGSLRLFVVTDLVSHEKLYLMEAENGGTRVLTGSANLSERAFSGKQNEGYILYEDDDAAWSYYTERYEKIKSASALGVPKRALLSEELDVGDLPAFSEENGTQIIAVEDGSPENGIVRKVVSSSTPKHFAGLSSVVPRSKGVARLDRRTRGEAITYMKSNRRTADSNPEEYLSIDTLKGKVMLSGKKLDLEVTEDEVRADVEAWMKYFEGFSLFRGEKEKLARDYFSFWSWLWFGPLLCDLRNAARARHEDVQDYPIFGILYGKTNCGKSELVDTLMLSMFGKVGTTPTDWFTRNKVANLMAENRRYPLVFDDLERKRYSDYAVSLIKEDQIRLAEYPPVVLSMNATSQDAFETEVRKRCFVVYTGASLPDDAPEARELGRSVRRIKHDLSTALYREYLRRTLAYLREETPSDFLKLSSTILRDIISEHCDGELPEWCHIASMEAHRRGRHDKVREDLRQLQNFDKESWQRRGNTWVLRMPDQNAANRLRRDIPDYLLGTGNVGNLIVFDAEQLEDFLGMKISRNGNLSETLSRLLRRNR